MYNTHYTPSYQSHCTLLKCKWSRQLLQSERGWPISNSLFGTLPQDNGNSNRHNNNNNNNNNDDVELRNPQLQSLFLSKITFQPDLYLHQFHLITSRNGVSSAPSQLQESHQSSHFWFKEWTSHWSLFQIACWHYLKTMKSADDESTTKTKIILAIASIRANLQPLLLKTLLATPLTTNRTNWKQKKLSLLTSGLVFWPQLLFFDHCSCFFHLGSWFFLPWLLFFQRHLYNVLTLV